MYKDIILVLILLIIAGGAGFYIYKAKKSGAHCVGCPHSKQCGKKTCSCGQERDSLENE